MQIETLVGLIGFGGAVVGAGGALLGGWLQQRHQAKTAKEQRRDERRFTAGRTALDMRIRLRRVAATRSEGNAESEEAWVDELVEWATTFDAALLVVPDGDEMRERVFEVVRHLGFYDSLGQTYSEANGWIDLTCKEAIELLSAFLREEPHPPRSRPFMDQIGMVQAHLRARTNPS
ncbi:hypothetical protein ACFYRJ_38445 [Streptomyces sp. NPDC005531]|uniref:hypothetical protein n=1 Tax=Streptomyces sp. NPDC005531 TaxID=3364722 RepID=UPI00368F2AA7